MLAFRKRKDDVDVASCLANLHRLNAVAESGLMGSPRRDHIDALTRDAADRLDAPMAFVSVLDDHWQFLVSEFGADEAVAASRGTDVERTYCQFVVAMDDVLVVNDATADALVVDHPATHEGIRAYLGVPLRRGGYCLGSFCVVDVEPRGWTEEDLAVLQTLADAAMARMG